MEICTRVCRAIVSTFLNIIAIRLLAESRSRLRISDQYADG